MSFKLIFLAMAMLFGIPALSYSRYGDSCWGCGLVGDEFSLWLFCTCVSASAQLVSTNINLQQCYVDNNGNLEYAKNGNFYGSCADYGLDGSTKTVLTAYCKAYDNSWKSTWIDMYYTIGNSDGNLVC